MVKVICDGCGAVVTRPTSYARNPARKATCGHCGRMTTYRVPHPVRDEAAAKFIERSRYKSAFAWRLEEGKKKGTGQTAAARTAAGDFSLGASHPSMSLQPAAAAKAAAAPK